MLCSLERSTDTTPQTHGPTPVATQQRLPGQAPLLRWILKSRGALQLRLCSFQCSEQKSKGMTHHPSLLSCMCCRGNTGVCAHLLHPAAAQPACTVCAQEHRHC